MKRKEREAARNALMCGTGILLSCG
jgi:hypothetical protein